MVDDQGTIQELRLLGRGHGAELGAAVALELYGQTLAPIHDQQGHVVSLIDASTGQACESYRYTAFGAKRNNSMPKAKRLQPLK